MNRKSFIKYSTLLSGAVFINPNHLWAAPKNKFNKTIFCIWGDGVALKDLKNYYEKRTVGEGVISHCNFDIQYKGNLDSHRDARLDIAGDNFPILSINVLHENIDMISYIKQSKDSFIIIRFIGCDAAHYNNALYHKSVEKYNQYTSQIEQYLFSNDLFRNNAVLLIATEMGRDAHGGEMEHNSGTSYSHHCSAEARKTGLIARSHRNFKTEINRIERIKTTQDFLTTF